MNEALLKRLTIEDYEEAIFYLNGFLPDNFELIPFKAHHLLEFNIREEQAELYDVLKANYYNLYHYGKTLEQIMSHGMTLKVNGDIIVCAGITPYWPGVGDGWFIFSDKIHEGFKANPRAFFKVFKAAITALPYRRMQTWARGDFDTSHVFLEKLGFHRESTLEEFGPYGGDYYMYAKINKEYK